jgi:leucyl-tRNA synthetase
MDRWLESRFQGHIGRTTLALERFQTRQAVQEAFSLIEADLKWYRRRLPPRSPGGASLRDLCFAWVRLLAPFIPFTAERLWKELGGDGLVSFAAWPEPADERVDGALEISEELLARTVEDIESILKVIKLAPTRITLFTAPGWKRAIFSTVASAENKSTVIKEIMREEEMRKRGKEVTDAVRQCTTLIHRLPPAVVSSLLQELPDETTLFREASGFLSREVGVPVVVEDAESNTHPRASSALPFKPAIVIE